MSENTMNAALKRMGYSSDQITAHGFRATFSTLANESGLNYDFVQDNHSISEANRTLRGLMPLL
jgi:integrase